GLQAARCRAAPAFELNLPALTHHRLFLFSRPPEELDLRYEGVKRHRPPAAGSVSLLPADSPAWVRSSRCKDELHLFLEPRVVWRGWAPRVPPPPPGGRRPPRRTAGPPPHPRAPFWGGGPEQPAGPGAPPPPEPWPPARPVTGTRHSLPPPSPRAGEPARSP